MTYSTAKRTRMIRSLSLKRLCLSSAVIISFLVVYWTQVVRSLIQFPSAPSCPSLNSIRIQSNEPLTLRHGDLPGYTGWPRPRNSLVKYFHLDQIDSVATPGSNFSLTVTCRGHASCHNAHSLFYVRAYGRAILPGIVTDVGNSSYIVTVLPFDTGRYQLEVVLTFSTPPNLNTMPAPGPGYEGYLLPGFPIEFHVFGPTEPTDAKSIPLCRTKDLVEDTPTSVLSKGRWLVTEKFTERDFDPKDTALLTYNDMIGFRADFVRPNCRLLSKDELLSGDVLLRTIEGSGKWTKKPLHVVFIGDSHCRLQRSVFQNYFGGRMKTTQIKTNGGLYETLGDVQRQLDDLKSKDEYYFVIFNSGLHDILELCFHNVEKRERRQKYLNVSDEDISCPDVYRKYLRHFLELVNDFPAVLKVWQTTTAAWPKWGIYSVAFQPTRLEGYPLVPDSAEYFNGVAWEILQSSYPHFLIMDTYYLTLSRPDNREVTPLNKISGHLMHGGPEVYSVLTRQFAVMILDAME